MGSSKHEIFRTPFSKITNFWTIWDTDLSNFPGNLAFLGKIIFQIKTKMGVVGERGSKQFIIKFYRRL